MNKDNFFDILGDIDERYISEAYTTNIKMKKIIWIKRGAIAACLCLVIAGTILWMLQKQHVPEKYDVVQIECDRVVYDNVDTLISNSDLIVSGYFIDDASNRVIKEYSDAFKKEIIVDAEAKGVFHIDKIYKGNIDLEDIDIYCRYGYDNDSKQLVTFSCMTPMESGDKWLYFLNYVDEVKGYYTSGDYTGRYSLEALNDIENYDKYEKNGALGVHDGASPNLAMYRAIGEKWFN